MQSLQVSDIVTLLPACDKTCWVGVSMHCDDYGVARGLPVRSIAMLSVVVVYGGGHDGALVMLLRMLS